MIHARDCDKISSRRISLFYVILLIFVTTSSVLFFQTRLTQQENGHRRLGGILSSQNMMEHIPIKRIIVDEVPEDINAPIDMWRYPSEYPTWEPVPLPDCCADPRFFTHSEQFSNKFTTVCSDDRNVPRYYGPGMGLTSNDVKMALMKTRGDLVMIGDSMTRQWFEQLSCYLGGMDSWTGFAKIPIEQNRGIFEEQMTEMLMRAFPSWRKKGNFGELGGVSSFASFEFSIDNEYTNTYLPTTKRVIMQYTNSIDVSEMKELIQFYHRIYPRGFHKERPLFLINLGLHYNKPAHKGSYDEKDLVTHMKEMVRICYDLDARCIFRETSPQHFQTQEGNGLYSGNTVRHCMEEPPATFDTLGNWRNDILHQVVSEFNVHHKNNQGFIKVMPIFHRMSGLNINHKSEIDCTHWHLDPETWEPWHLSLAEVLNDVATSEKI